MTYCLLCYRDNSSIIVDYIGGADGSNIKCKKKSTITYFPFLFKLYYNSLIIIIWEKTVYEWFGPYVGFCEWVLAGEKLL